MKFEKEHKKRGGRLKGVPNKLTTSLKELILRALDEVGGLKYLCKVAADDPRTFCNLVGRVLPLDVNMDMSDRLAIFLSRVDGSSRHLPALPPPEIIEQEQEERLN